MSSPSFPSSSTTANTEEADTSTRKERDFGDVDSAPRGDDGKLLTEIDEYTYPRGARALNRLAKCTIPLAYLLTLTIYFAQEEEDTADLR